VATTFGEVGLVSYCGFIVAFNVALFSYGVFLFERKLSWKLVKGTLLNPNIIAVALGVVVFLLNINIPVAIDSSVGFGASATTPLSLICIGYMLSHAKFLALLKKWRLFLAAAIQLVVGPALAFFLLTAFGFPREVIVVCTLIQALPTATSLGLFAKKYGGNHVEASELVAISTVMSVVTLPVMISILLT
jgi:predicted permease